MNYEDKGSTPGHINPVPTNTSLPAWAALQEGSQEKRIWTTGENSNQKDVESSGLGSPDEASPIEEEVHTYPEGGLDAWLVVLGSFCVMTAAFGMMNIVGTFQAYLTTHQLKDYNEGAVSWIFSVYVFLAFFCGLQIGPIFDAHGPRLLILSGSIMIVAAVMLLSICTAYWHFMLVYGILGGIATSLLFTPAVSSIGHWFLKGRGNATGLAATGGSFGGVIFPLMLQECFPKLGFAWATRLLGFLFLFLVIIGNLLIRSRLPAKPGSSVWPDFRIFRDPAFSLTTAGVFALEWGLFIPITYLTTFAQSAPQAFSPAFAYQVIAIFNGASFFGRWAPGWAADHIGRYNAMILTILICLLSTFMLWLPAAYLIPSSPGSSAIAPLTIVYSIFFGFASGSNISLTPVCVGQLCKTQEYGRYYATCYTLVALGSLTGIPIAGALLEACGGDYWGVVVFTGLCYALALALFVGARGINAGWRWKTIY